MGEATGSHGAQGEGGQQPSRARKNSPFLPHRHSSLLTAFICYDGDGLRRFCHSVSEEALELR